MRIGVIGIIALMLAAVTQAVAEDTATAQPTPAEAAAPYLTHEQRPDVGAILSLAPQNEAGAELAALRKRTESDPETCKAEREILSGEHDLFDRPPF
jgi:hypothetical protein